MKKLRWLIEYILYKTVTLPARLLPAVFRLKTGELLALLFHAVSPRHRRTALKNLEIAFPEKDSKWRRKTARQCYRFFGKMMGEIMNSKKLDRRNYDKYISETEGVEELEKAYRSGNGVFCMTAHYGNWELLGHVVSYLGFPTTVLARKLDNPLLDAELVRRRILSGNRVIYKENAIRRIIKELKENRIIGFLMDQNQIKREGVFIDFFGVAASTSPTLATLSLKYGVPIIPCFCVPDRRKKGKYRALFGEEIRLAKKSGNIEDDILKLTKKCNKYLEKTIRENPAYWLWMHKRWKTRPEGSKPIY